MQQKDSGFEVLTEDYTPMIHKIINTLNIYKDRDMYFHIGMIGLWEAYQRFNIEKGSFTAFAYSTIRGKILTELAHERRFTDRHSLEGESLPFEREDEGSLLPLEKELIDTYCTECNLTPNQRKWIAYAVFHQLKVSEIAKLEGVPLTTVKTWRRGALEKLRKSLSTNR